MWSHSNQPYQAFSRSRLLCQTPQKKLLCCSQFHTVGKCAQAADAVIGAKPFGVKKLLANFTEFNRVSVLNKYSNTEQ